MALDKYTAHLAMRIERKLYAQWLRYREECEEYYRKGYRPAYCEHGTYQWTDYDNICGGCEDGYTMEYGDIRRRAALDMARAQEAEAEKIGAAIEALRRLVGQEAVNLEPCMRRTAELLELER